MSLVIPFGTYPAGVYPFGPTAIAQGLTRAVCAIDISQMTTPDKSYTYLAQISYDSGATWGDLTGASFVGQVVKVGVTKQTNTVTLQQPTNPNRKVKGTFTIIGTITTSIDLVVS